MTGTVREGSEFADSNTQSLLRRATTDGGSTKINNGALECSGNILVLNHRPEDGVM